MPEEVGPQRTFETRRFDKHEWALRKMVRALPASVLSNEPDVVGHRRGHEAPARLFCKLPQRVGREGSDFVLNIGSGPAEANHCGVSPVAL